MRRVVAAVAVAALTPLATPGDTAIPRLPVVRVRVETATEAAFVAASFDETHAKVPGAVEIVLWPGDAARLRDLGYTADIVVGNLLTEPPTRGPLVELPGPDRDDYRHLADYDAEMAELATQHPALVRRFTLPYRSVEGRTIYGIEIAADVRARDGRPTFHVDGVHHAREWPSSEYTMIYAHYLVEGFGRDPAIADLLRRLRVTVVPVVNVDGFDYSRESVLGEAGSAASEGAYWRKNRRSLTGITAPGIQRNPEAHGTDPNRNYGYLWGDDIGGSSSAPVDQTYRGPAPFSEPESADIRSLLLSRHVTGMVTNHTSGRLVMHPWGHTDEDTPDEKFFVALGAKLADAMGGYQNIKAIELYATSGGSRDWAYGTLNTLAYTFEHETAFHPPYAGSVGENVAGVIRAFDLVAQAAADPARHCVITGRVVDGRVVDGGGSRPVTASLVIGKAITNPLWPKNPSGQETVKYTLSTTSATDANGRFTWHVNPSARPQSGADGEREAYTLTVVAGSRTRGFTLRCRRGQWIDLGTIRL